MLEQYNNLLILKNQTTNLTAHRCFDSSMKYNVTDSLLFNNELEQYFVDGVFVLDIGSGGGCPAIPLKISFPNIDLTMIDSVSKKTNFLNEVVFELGLQKARAIHTRAEDFAKQKRESFDVVVARAVAGMNTLVEYALPFVAVGGVFVAFKGQNVTEELRVAERAIKMLGGEVLDVKTAPLDSETVRSLVIIKKVKQTPSKFPREKNLPRTSPLI